MGVCSHCGSPIQEGQVFCAACGQRVSSPSEMPKVAPASAAAATAAVPATERRRLGDNAGMRFVLPIGCSGWAVASGYCGLFSIIPWIGIPLAVLSIIFGILGFSAIRSNTHSHGVARIIIGWVFTFLSIVGHGIMICFLCGE